jgi:hypothetical protein
METIYLKLIDIYKDLKVFLLARRALLILLLLNYTSAKLYFYQTILIYLLTMSLSTLRPISTPRERVYRRAKQYFNISTLSAHTYKAIFLPSLAKNPSLVDNWSTKDEATFDKRLQEKGSKKILTTKKRFDIKY